MNEPDPTPTAITRRAVVAASLGLAVAACTTTSTRGTSAMRSDTREGTEPMNTITTEDGTRIFYKDWGQGQPVVFSHGWPLTADAWDEQMLFLAERGFRCIAHDRRSHGRSSQTWHGNEMDTYADDLARLCETLDLKGAIHVGHSTGGGEVARYIGRHGTKRVAKAVLISAVTPQMVKSPGNPGGMPLAAFDDVRKKTRADRSQFFLDLPTPFYGGNRPNGKLTDGMRDSFWRQGMQGGFKGILDCIKAFSETDFTADLARFDVPTLLLHGDDDQIVPIDITARRAVKMIRGAKLEVYAGADHGICQTHAERVNADLLAFCRG
jgi:non-heme chloroperoxidase